MTKEPRVEAGRRHQSGRRLDWGGEKTESHGECILENQQDF